MEKKFNEEDRYDDIIHLPHHVSQARPRMTKLNRAAQFSPFAALPGYDGAVKETERLTNKRMELDEDAKTILDEKLRILYEQLRSHPEIEITYFKPDEKKAGGAYVSTIGMVKKIDSYERTVLMQDGTRISIDEIISITGDIFQYMEAFI